MHLAQCLHHRKWPINSCWKSTHKTGMPGIIDVFFVFGFSVRSNKDTKKWIPHLAITSATGPGTQLQLTCRPPSSRTVQKDRRGDGPALPWLPRFQPDLSWSYPQPHSPHVPESRKRASPSKVAKAAFLWTTQEMYVRKLFLVLFLCGCLTGFVECHWVCWLCRLRWGYTERPHNLVLGMEQTSPCQANTRWSVLNFSRIN